MPTPPQNSIKFDLFLWFSSISRTNISLPLLQKKKKIIKLANSVSEKDLTRAKASAKVEYASQMEQGVSVCEHMDKQLISTGKTFSITDYAAGIDQVSAADIQKVLSCSFFHVPLLSREIYLTLVFFFSFLFVLARRQGQEL